MYRRQKNSLIDAEEFGHGEFSAVDGAELVFDLAEIAAQETIDRFGR